MGWEIKLSSKTTLRQPEDAGLNPGGADCITGGMREKMRSAVSSARSMALVAMYTITRYPGIPEVQDALNKYFNLGSDDANYDRVCSRIAKVYSKVINGMDNGYNIYVFDPAGKKILQNANAFVPGSEKDFGRKALNLFFLSDDDTGHVNWEDMQRMAYQNLAFNVDKREIHLRLSVIQDNPVDAIARTLLHESTHKWANTNDVCYKHSTAGKVTKDAETLQSYVRQGFGYGDPTEARPDKSRVTFIKVSNRGDPAKVHAYPKNQFVANHETWINNADSYAWAARRLWKKCETIVNIGAV